VDASGRRTEYRYDANGNRTHVRTPDGRETVTTYDALNRATRIEQPDGSAQVIVYRPDGRKQSETDPRGVTTTYGYDAAGRLTSVQQSGIAQATAYAWDQTGAKTTQTDPLNRAVIWAYDRAGRPVSRTLPDGQQERFEYDLEGQTQRTGHLRWAHPAWLRQHRPADNAHHAGHGSNRRAHRCVEERRRRQKADADRERRQQQSGPEPLQIRRQRAPHRAANPARHLELGLRRGWAHHPAHDQRGQHALGI
jgi:YD repeat-containing protein